MFENWTGKRYWLIGASDGLGAALARQLSNVGAEVILSARDETALQAVADSLPGRASIFPVDVTDRAALEAAAHHIGEIDGMVYLAGVYWPFGAKEWNSEQAEAMADVNFTGAMRAVGAVLPTFVARDQGHIVITSSLTAFGGLPGAAPYVATKAGLMGLAESLHADLRNSGVKVQLVNPGFIKTRLTAKNDFAMPAIMEPEKAAHEVFEHMCGDTFSRSFPFGFSLLFRFGRFLPSWLYFPVFARNS
ncbi:SDR family NAD(P)-dependent oxidoreductase [Maritimibacter alkaliphilus]|uniref:SDR family NAD(P)-dependent oxidoreductase n=1 Tax=Maritimibacter alkaliphilus TaxID=404236 RepID=UPI001C965CDC|nr:SDR family NAD(P)-dependent oxidoreductase [Maritimibacter alkaliphilus]MBY6090404.1 SDR family NAD(P)-dependent oxidoreductase [Maritimibacter alkaliphilus]